MNKQGGDFIHVPGLGSIELHDHGSTRAWMDLSGLGKVPIQNEILDRLIKALWRVRMKRVASRMVKRLGVRTKNAAWAKETLQRATEVTNRAAQELSKFNPVLEQELRSVVIPVLNRLIG